MEKFCLKCGAVADETATSCPGCGTPLGQPAANAYPQPATPSPQTLPPRPVAPSQNYPPQGYQQQPTYPPQNYPPPPGYPQQSYPTFAPKKKSGSAFKWILGILVTLCVLGGLFVWGVYYAIHRVKNKFDAIATETQQEQANLKPLNMPVCNLLSANDVGAAIGVPIVSAEGNAANVCVYTARGTADDMTSKHMDAAMKQSGATADQQHTIEQITNMLKPKKEAASQPVDPNATTPVLMIDVDAEDARVAMKVLKALLGNQPGREKISIGDEAFDAQGSVLMVMKNGHLIRFTYATCPCGTDAIKPLAKKVADQL